VRDPDDPAPRSPVSGATRRRAAHWLSTQPSTAPTVPTHRTHPRALHRLAMPPLKSRRKVATRFRQSSPSSTRNSALFPSASDGTIEDVRPRGTRISSQQFSNWQLAEPKPQLLTANCQLLTYCGSSVRIRSAAALILRGWIRTHAAPGFGTVKSGSR